MGVPFLRESRKSFIMVNGFSLKLFTRSYVHLRCVRLLDNTGRSRRREDEDTFSYVDRTTRPIKMSPLCWLTTRIGRKYILYVFSSKMYKTHNFPKLVRKVKVPLSSMEHFTITLVLLFSVVTPNRFFFDPGPHLHD